jgi:hypothetical protein
MGNLTYAFGDAQSDLIASSESSVSGETSRFVESDKVRGDVDKARDDLSRFGKVFGMGWLIFSFLGSVVVGLLFVTIFPLTMLGVSQLASSSLGKSLGIGALITLAMFPLTLALIATIVGIPLAGLLLVVYCISTHIAKLVAAYALGWFIAAATNLSKPNSLLVFLIGLTTFYLLRLVPGLGWLVSVAFTWIGLGAMWQYAVAHKKKL